MHFLVFEVPFADYRTIMTTTVRLTPNTKDESEKVQIQIAERKG